MKFNSISAKWSITIGPGWILSLHRQSRFSSSESFKPGLEHTNFQLKLGSTDDSHYIIMSFDEFYLYINFSNESQTIRFFSFLYLAVSCDNIAFNLSTVAWSCHIAPGNCRHGYCFTIITGISYCKVVIRIICIHMAKNLKPPFLKFSQNYPVFSLSQFCTNLWSSIFHRILHTTSPDQ